MEQKLVGHIGVDAGMIMVGDPCYLKDWKDGGFNFNPEDELTETRELYPFSYQGACEATCSAERVGKLAYPMGHEGAAVVVSSGWGDGFYPVYIERKHGRVISMHVYFDEDPNVEEE